MGILALVAKTTETCLCPVFAQFSLVVGPLNERHHAKVDALLANELQGGVLGAFHSEVQLLRLDRREHLRHCVARHKASGIHLHALEGIHFGGRPKLRLLGLSHGVSDARRAHERCTVRSD